MIKEIVFIYLLRKLVYIREKVVKMEDTERKDSIYKIGICEEKENRIIYKNSYLKV